MASSNSASPKVSGPIAGLALFRCATVIKSCEDNDERVTGTAFWHTRLAAHHRMLLFRQFLYDFYHAYVGGC
jgi:hypothetical protein